MVCLTGRFLRRIAALLVLLLLLSAVQTAFSQPPPRPKQPGDEEAAAACAACCGGTFAMIAGSILAVIIIIVVNIGLLIWVARDAKNRNMDSAVIWMLMVMFTGPLGFVIYLFSRPQGNLIRCDECGNSRLQASRRCPHCGNA